MLLEVEDIDRIVVATDCAEISEIILSMDVKRVEVFRRSDENAQDHSTTESVMLEYINADDLIEANDTFILVQATNVFTKAADIIRGLSHFSDVDVDSVLSCIESKQFFWSRDGQSLNYDYNNRPRRQDFEGQVIENGAFYINKVDSIIKFQNRLSGNIKPIIMPAYTSLEIDEPADWIMAEEIMRKVINSNN